MLRLAPKSKNSCNPKSLDENISNLVMRRDMKNTNLFLSYLFTNKMDIHFNVFGVLMLNRIVKKIHSTYVVTI